MGTTDVSGGPAPGKRTESRRTGTVLIAATFLVAAVAVATTHLRSKPVGGDGAGNASVPAAASPAPPGEVAAGHTPTAPPKAQHPPRRLDDVNRKELETTLPKGAPIEITAPEGDDEAFLLAQQIRAFLRSEKYPVGDVTRRAPDPSAKGVGLDPLPGGKWRVIVGEAD